MPSPASSRSKRRAEQPRAAGQLIHFQRGLAYYDKHQYDKAIADFSETIRTQSRRLPPAMSVAAPPTWHKDDLHKAIADFSEALKLAPGQAFAHLQRGIAYHRIGEADKALEDYSEAIKLTPRDPTPYVNRGIVYYTKKGQYEAAINDFNKALELNPKEVNALINRGITYRQRSETDKALADFSRGDPPGHADRGHPAPGQPGRARQGPRARQDGRPGGARLLSARHGADRQAGLRGRAQRLQHDHADQSQGAAGLSGTRRGQPEEG